MKYEFLSLDLEDGYQVLHLTEDKVEKKWTIQLPISADCLFSTEEEKEKRINELTDEQVDFLEEVEEQFFSKFEDRDCALAAIATSDEDVVAVFVAVQETRDVETIYIAFSREKTYLLEKIGGDFYLHADDEYLPQNFDAEKLLNKKLSFCLQKYLEEKSGDFPTLSKEETLEALIKLAGKFTAIVFKLEDGFSVYSDKEKYATIQQFWHYHVFNVVNDFLDENYIFNEK